MIHVKQIRQYIEDGRNAEARTALENLLGLGPNNTEALKLKAFLLEMEGRFLEEAKVWEQVLKADPEDEEAIDYIIRRQMEDREHFYFTDELPGEGRRFLAYPRQLVMGCVRGLVGCFLFLTITKLWGNIDERNVLLFLFGLLVIAPFIPILVSFFGGLKSVSIQKKGVEVATRLKTVFLPWQDISDICLTHRDTPRGSRLALVVRAKKPEISIEIDLNPNSSPIRARSYLVREITRLFREPTYCPHGDLGLDPRKTISF